MQNKEREALEEAKRRRKEIEREHKSREKAGLDRYSGMSGGAGRGPGGAYGGGMGGGMSGQQPYIMDRGNTYALKKKETNSSIFSLFALLFLLDFFF